MGKLSDNKLAKLNALDAQGGFWYITKQNLVFRDLCFMAKILEAWGDRKEESYQSFFDSHKEMKEFGSLPPLTAHRATKNCEYIGLIRPSNNYKAENLTPFYFALKNICEGDFDRLSSYSEIINKQLERMFVDSNTNDVYTVNFQICPFMFLFKVLLLIGDITKSYKISKSEFKLFVATAQSWMEYFEVVESILRYREDKAYQAQCDINAARVSDVRYNILAENHSQITVVGSDISITESEIKNVRRKVSEYELSEPIHSAEDIFNTDIVKKITNPLQKISYGAPGTGKSYGIKKIIKEHNIDEKTQVIRTTFHPDSDYSTFVGAYKPTMEKKAAKQPILKFTDLVGKLKEYKQQHDNATLACTKFGFDYHDSLTNIREDKTDNILNLVKAVYDPHNSLDTNVRAGKIIGESLAEELYEEKIVYKFVPQAFLKAYVGAWKNQEQNMFLVIEEINRGNCAQIFGDIFQLLDRNDNGESEYPIKADQDIQNYLAEVFADCDNLPKNIKSGEELILPSNLYIWATMNTSDQSLFPIDSAFKRRWDWEYVPIKYANDNWIIEVGQKRYYWVSFQKQVNEKVYNINHSEDKMLGDFFVKADKQDVITESVLLNKILFYLWNDVCKDGEGDIFKKDANTDLTFSDLYGEEGTTNLIAMMKYLGVEEEDDDDIFENDGKDSGKPRKTHAKYSIAGSTETYRTPKMVEKVISDFANAHPEMSVDEMITKWNSISGRKDLLTENWEPSPTDNSNPNRRTIITWNGKSVWVTRGWTEEICQTFIKNVKDELGIDIVKVN